MLLHSPSLFDFFGLFSPAVEDVVVVLLTRNKTPIKEKRGNLFEQNEREREMERSISTSRQNKNERER